MAKIAFFELGSFFEHAEEEKNYIKDHLRGHSIGFFEKPLEEVSSDAEILAVFIYSKINAKLLDKYPKTKLITTMSTGFDHIDLEECKRRKIIVCNVPAYGSSTVAEHAMGLVLAFAKNLVPAIERTRTGDFSIKGLQGFDLKDKTIGIIGTGKIGKNMAKFSSAFGMRVIAYDPYPDKEWARQLSVSYVSFDELLEESDVISIHVPENPSTHHLINMQNITKIKRGCILINTARGGIVETQAILKGLTDNILAGAGLDVLEEECSIKEEKELLHKMFERKCDLKTLLAEHMLLQNKKVIITPHSAFYTKEALRSILDTTIDNIAGFISGVPKNKVN